MKKVLLAAVMTLSVVPAFAQYYPNPIPNPRQCQAAAVDRFNRVLATFWAWRDPRGLCHDAIRNCNFEIRRRGWYDARCVLLHNRW